MGVPSVNLVGVVLNEGSVFSIRNVARTAKVEYLKHEINKQEAFSCPPRQLTLFLARKSVPTTNEDMQPQEPTTNKKKKKKKHKTKPKEPEKTCWLTIKDPALAALREGTISNEIREIIKHQRMDETSSVDDYFGNLFVQDEHDIQILVHLPLQLRDRKEELQHGVVTTSPSACMNEQVLEPMLTKALEKQSYKSMQSLVHKVQNTITNQLENHFRKRALESEEARLRQENKRFRAFRDPLWYPSTTTTALPTSFRTERRDTVDAFIDTLFPTLHHTSEDPWFVFVRAPPLSGKSAFCDLLWNRLNGRRLAARVLANEITKTEGFMEHFKSLFHWEMHEFWDFTESERVILIDEAHETFKDDALWGFLQNVHQGRHHHRGVTVVMFGTFASFDPVGGDGIGGCRNGPPFHFNEANSAVLLCSSSTPGLQLSRKEFDEMAATASGLDTNSRDLIWHLSSGQIGMAHAVLTFLDNSGLIDNASLQDRIVSASSVELALRSTEMLQFLEHHCCRMPTLNKLERLVQDLQLSHNLVTTIRAILQSVAFGFPVASNELSKTRISSEAVRWLLQFGFLDETLEEQLQFPSDLHLKLWVNSIRQEPSESIQDLSLSGSAFVAKCVATMRASTFTRVQTAGLRPCDLSDQRQLLMELYRAATLCLSRNVLVTPEWPKHRNSGFTGVFIRDGNDCWFWSLVGDWNDEAPESYGSQIVDSHHALFDFRTIPKQSSPRLVGSNQAVNVHVVFDEDFTTAAVKLYGLEDEQQEVLQMDLMS